MDDTPTTTRRRRVRSNTSGLMARSAPSPACYDVATVKTNTALSLLDRAVGTWAVTGSHPYLSRPQTADCHRGLRHKLPPTDGGAAHHGATDEDHPPRVLRRLAERDVRREPREGALREEGGNMIPKRKLGDGARVVVALPALRGPTSYEGALVAVRWRRRVTAGSADRPRGASRALSAPTRRPPRPRCGRRCPRRRSSRRFRRRPARRRAGGAALRTPRASNRRGCASRPRREMRA